MGASAGVTAPGGRAQPLEAEMLPRMIRVRQTFPRPRVADIPRAVAATPLLKGTGYEIYPPMALGLVALTARRHGRNDLAALAVLGVSFALAFLGWDLLKGHFHRTAFTTPSRSLRSPEVA